MSEPEFWSTFERLEHERHHFADIARHPHCRLCGHEWEVRRHEHASTPEPDDITCASADEEAGQ